jgi:hypothetical protein
LPDSDLKYPIVEKMSYLLVIFPFSSRMRFDLEGDEEGEGERVEASLCREVMASLGLEDDLTGGRTLLLSRAWLLERETKEEVSDVCLNFISFS